MIKNLTVTCFVMNELLLKKYKLYFEKSIGKCQNGSTNLSVGFICDKQGKNKTVYLKVTVKREI